MSILPVSLTQHDKALALMAGALEKNLQKRAETDQLYKETVEELRAVNQAQAERIQLLEAALVQSEEARKQESAILNGEHAAEIARLETRHMETLGWVANLAKGINQLAAIIFNPRIYGPQVPIPAGAEIKATAEDFINMRGIIQRVNTNTL